MTLLEQNEFAQNADFNIKVKIASIKAANDTLSGIDRSQYLINYAQTIVSQPNDSTWVGAMAFGVVTNPAITVDSTDGDIQFTVNSLFVNHAKAHYKIIDELPNANKNKEQAEMKK